MIPTAEEWFKTEYGTKDITEITLNGAVIIRDMIAFAELHVVAALKANDCGELGLIKYPLTNIQ